MDERDLEPEEAAVRLLVDQLDALLGEFGELRARGRSPRRRRGACPGRGWRGTCPTGVSSPSDASSSTRLSPTRTAAASTPCVGNRVAVLDLGTEETSIRVDCLVEILDGHSEMVDPLRLHARGS